MREKLQTKDVEPSEAMMKLRDVLEWSATALRIPTYPTKRMGGYVPKGFVSGCTFMNEVFLDIGLDTTHAEIENAGLEIDGLYLAHATVIGDLVSDDVDIDVDRRVIIEGCDVKCEVVAGHDWRTFDFIKKHKEFMAAVFGISNGELNVHEELVAKLDDVYGADSVTALLGDTYLHVLTLKDSIGVLGNYMVISYNSIEEYDTLLHYFMMAEAWSQNELPSNVFQIDTYPILRAIREEVGLVTMLVKSGEMSSEFLSTVMANIWLKYLTSGEDSPNISNWKHVAYMFDQNSHRIFSDFKECVGGDIGYVTDIMSTMTIKILGVQVTTLAGTIVRKEDNSKAYLTFDFKQRLAAFIASHVMPFVESGLATTTAAGVPWTSLQDGTVDDFLSTHMAFVILEHVGNSGITEPVYQLSSQEKFLVLSSIHAVDLSRIMPGSSQIH